MSQPDTQPENRPSWWKLALLIAVGGNLLLGGVLIGNFFHRAHPPGHWLDRAFSEATENLPPDIQDAIRQSLRARRPLMARQFAALRQARLDLREQVMAEPFDAAKLEAAFANLRQQSMMMQKELHLAMIEAMAKMPPEARLKLAEWHRHRR